MSDLFLTDEQLATLTHRTRCDAQLRMLRYMGIEHRVRSDGSLAVLRSHVEKVFGGVQDDSTERRKVEPNWSAI